MPPARTSDGSLNMSSTARRAGRLDTIGDLRPCRRRWRRRRLAFGLDGRRAERAVECEHIRPLPYADARERDNDGCRNETLDQRAIRAARRDLVLIVLVG